MASYVIFPTKSTAKIKHRAPPDTPLPVTLPCIVAILVKKVYPIKDNLVALFIQLNSAKFQFIVSQNIGVIKDKVGVFRLYLQLFVRGRPFGPERDWVRGMKKFWQEFKTFAFKGNVVNLAVGVMIGAAFQNVVAALSEHILSPVIGLFVGQNFDTLAWDVPGLGVRLTYGAFITAVVNFFITALIIFLIVKAMNKLMDAGKAPEAPPPPATKACPLCFGEVDIRAVKCRHCGSALEGDTEAL